MRTNFFRLNTPMLFFASLALGSQWQRIQTAYPRLTLGMIAVGLVVWNIVFVPKILA